MKKANQEIKDELNGKENHNTIEDSKTNKLNKSQYSENINKIDKSLARFMKNKT